MLDCERSPAERLEEPIALGSRRMFGLSFCVDPPGVTKFVIIAFAKFQIPLRLD